MPTEAAVAHVTVACYADHAPLHRQPQALARQGIEIGRDVLAGRLGTAAAEIRPVMARLREILLASARLFADETTTPVLEPGRGQTKKGFAWAVARDGLLRFVEDGRIELDTNTVERAIRPLVPSRKNALFASGDDGGARWAAMASLIETCKLNGANPQPYIADLLTRLVNGWPNSRIDELMPWH